jgi:hypothetical protein
LLPLSLPFRLEIDFLTGSLAGALRASINLVAPKVQYFNPTAS